jgi:hygromycin-B 7''-O-kinase
LSRENVATIWPGADDEEDFDAIVRDEGALGPGVRALCASLGVTEAPSRHSGGSLPVYAIGDLVLKLFPPVHVEEMPVEAGVLAAVRGRLPVPTPGVHAAGTFERWGYVLMDRMPGVPLSACWSSLGTAERDGTGPSGSTRNGPGRSPASWPGSRSAASGPCCCTPRS